MKNTVVQSSGQDWRDLDEGSTGTESSYFSPVLIS